jgi:hypothetical protein
LDATVWATDSVDKWTININKISAIESRPYFSSTTENEPLRYIRLFSLLLRDMRWTHSEDLRTFLKPLASSLNFKTQTTQT